MDQAFDLPRVLDDTLPIEDFAGPPELLDEAQRVASRLRSVIPRDCRLLALHAETKPAKMWPAERFSAVLDWLLHRDPSVVVAELGWQDVGLDYGRHEHRVVRCRSLPLPLAMAFVGTADLFLGVDSCFLHAADLYRVPGVGLFGPSRSHEFGFRFAPHRHVDGNGRMDAIQVEPVIEAIEALEEATSR
jgi:ADP-heptose:LPS heptosyltransferase